MHMQEYFENRLGVGVLSTADNDGKVDAAIYAKPHVLADGTIAFIMRDRLTHKNITANPYAVYLFIENAGGYKGIRLFLKKVREDDDAELINLSTLRSMTQAYYSPENFGHFGLALSHYAHFTSPIRRYPDLLVHRAIHHVIERRKAGDYPVGREQMDKLCEQCSHRSRRAEEAERDVNDRLKAIYMERHIGDEFKGLLTGVTSFGLFVELTQNNVSGLVHITSLPNDYYHFDPVVHRLTGDRSGRVFQLTQKVRVKVMAVNLEDRKIDFELVP